MRYIFFIVAIAGLLSAQVADLSGICPGAPRRSLGPADYAAFGNPAALGYLKHYTAYAIYDKPYRLSFLDRMGASAAIRTGKWGAVGLSAIQLAVDGDDGSAYSEGNYSLLWGRRFLEDVHSTLDVGLRAHFINTSFGRSLYGVDITSQSAYSLDIGVIGSIYRRTQIALYGENIVASSDNLDIERRLLFGLGYSPYREVNTVLELEQDEEGFFSTGMLSPVRNASSR